MSEMSDAEAEKPQGEDHGHQEKDGLQLLVKNKGASHPEVKIRGKC